MSRHLFAALLAAFAAISAEPSLAKQPPRAEAAATRPSTAPDADAFGLALVAAARAQTWIPVLYDPGYRKIDYPMGDVPWYRGVCTDVVIRAYRVLGLDLQELVHRSGVGTGDTNIDHRRVDVLRKYFARHGQSLPVGKDPSAFRPGDVVTFHVPGGIFSKTHVAIVSDRKSAAGVPLVIHNRGLGVWEEDWLFSERITGHYRFGARAGGGRSASASR
jgi:hypothetical protein